MAKYIKCPKCDGEGEYHDETMELGKEKLVTCDMCKGQQEIKDKELIPNAVGKEITFQSYSSFNDEYFYSIQLSNEETFYLVSKSPIEIFREEELED